VKKKRNPLTPVGRVLQRGSPGRTLYYQPVLKGGALAPVAQTGTKGWAFSSGRAAPAREPGQQVLSDRANLWQCIYIWWLSREVPCAARCALHAWLDPIYISIY